MSETRTTRRLFQRFLGMLLAIITVLSVTVMPASAATMQTRRTYETCAASKVKYIVPADRTKAVNITVFNRSRYIALFAMSTAKNPAPYPKAYLRGGSNKLRIPAGGYLCIRSGLGTPAHYLIKMTITADSDIIITSTRPTTPSTPKPSTPSTPKPSTPSTPKPSTPSTPSTPKPSTSSRPKPSTPSTPKPMNLADSLYRQYKSLSDDGRVDMYRSLSSSEKRILRDKLSPRQWNNLLHHVQLAARRGR